MTKPICTIAARFGYLDHLAREGVDVRGSVRTSGSTHYLDGQLADLAGSLALRELATELDVPIFVRGASDYHAGATFTPRTARRIDAGTVETNEDSVRREAREPGPKDAPEGKVK